MIEEMGKFGKKLQNPLESDGHFMIKYSNLPIHNLANGEV